MKKILLLSTLLFGFVSMVNAQNSSKVYINEIRVNDASTDDVEFIELVGPAGTVITGFEIIHYNGSATSDGGVWTHTIGAFTIPDDGVTDNTGTNIGFYVYGAATIANVDESTSWSDNRIQNGPDGIVLKNASGDIIDAVAWGGAGDLTDDDPGTITTAGSTLADNYLHLTVGDDSGDNSLNAPDNVVGDNGTGWTNSAITPGAINGTQTSGTVALPIELKKFVGFTIDNKIYIEWQTASEENNSHFEIEYSTNGRDFAYLDKVAGVGTTAEIQNYQFTHTDATAGKNYYRLRQVDFDGAFEYSSVVAVTIKTNAEIEIRPTMVANYVQVVLEEGITNDINLQMLDLTGRLLKTATINRGTEQFELEVSNLEKGVYFIQFHNGGEVITRRFVKL